MYQNSKPRDGDQDGDRPNRRPFSNLVWLIILVIMALFIRSFATQQQTNGTETIQDVSYSTFIEQVEAGNVSEITVSGESIQGAFVEPVSIVAGSGEEIQAENFQTYRPPFASQGLGEMLQEAGVEINVVPETDLSWLSVLLSFLPFLLLIGLGYFFLRRAQEQGQGITSMIQSRARRYEKTEEETTFEDVAGVAGAKYELQEIIEFLKEPDRFQSLGAVIPKGVLLVGPPGTGKTLLARAVAGEANAPFFSITGSDFMEMFVGVGASRVRKLFEQAKQSAPAIIFIDELDSIGRKRGAGLGGGHDEREQTLNQLLSEMDGFEANQNVIVMAATNRPDILDPALLRPGRFDRQITVDLPTLRDREEILRIHSRNKPLSPQVDLTKIARGTPGFSGADLANLLNEAALLAGRKRKNNVEAEELDQARDKVILGLERENFSMTEEEQRLLAYHEAGHALVASVLPHTDPIHKVTIVPHGRAMGVTQQLPERDRYLYPRDYLLNRIEVMMGGRAAEELALNTMTSGAADDLKQATQLARKMVLEWGMSERVGQVSLHGENGNVFLGEELSRRREYSETTAREVDEEIRDILDDAYRRAKDILEQRRPALDRVVAALIEKEVISGSELDEILEASS